jgi:hypothetical protein
MSQMTEIFAAERDVVRGTQQTNVTDGASAAPVVITEQEVLFGTRVATSPRRATLPHRLIGAVRTAATSLRLPPPRQHYPADLGYLERSRMAREMDRL